MLGPQGAQKQEAAREEQKVPVPTLAESRLEWLPGYGSEAKPIEIQACGQA